MSVTSGIRDNNDTIDKQISLLVDSLQVVLNGNVEQKPFKTENIKELAIEFGVTSE